LIANNVRFLGLQEVVWVIYQHNSPEGPVDIECAAFSMLLKSDIILRCRIQRNENGNWGTHIGSQVFVLNL